MIKLVKIAVVAGSAMIATAAFAQSGVGVSGTGGTGVDFAAGIATVSNNPGVTLPGSSAGDGGAFGDSGVGRGIASLDAAAADGKKAGDKE